MPRLFAGNSAVSVGIVVAALSIWLSRKFGDPHFDPGASLIVGLVLIGSAFVLTRTLARKNGGLLMSDRMDPDQISHIRKIISADAAVASVGRLITAQLGPDSLFLTADVLFKRRLNPQELEQAIVRLERSIRMHHPAIQQFCLESESSRSRQPVALPA